MPTLAERIDKADGINHRLAELLNGRYDDARRLVLPLAYFNLPLDHHRAFLLLLRNGQFGSALVFVPMIRAHWVAKCATDDQVNEIAENDNFRFPKMHEMTKAVDAACSDPGEAPLELFQQAKKDAWSATNSYTHSGLLQLARQFTGDRIAATYPEEDLVSGINAATASVLLLGYLIARMTSQERKAEAIEEMFD